MQISDRERELPRTPHPLSTGRKRFQTLVAASVGTGSGVLRSMRVSSTLANINPAPT